MIAGTPTPFGPSWESLDLSDVIDFFASADDEGLTWEAKGTVIRTEHIQVAASAFGNSDLGGFLVLGARRPDRKAPWIVDGWTFPTEPRLWITAALLNDGVRPLPSYDSASWPVSDDRHVAVVNIRPSAVPPVLTRSGQAWQRQSSVSRQLTDPADLRALFERGEAARLRAVRTAEAGRDDLVSSPPEARQAKILVSMASPSLPPDVSTAVFRDATYQVLRRILDGPLRADPFLNKLEAGISQHALSVWNIDPFEGSRYAIRIGRHGSVAISLSDPDVLSGLETVVADRRAIARIWVPAISVLTELGASGPAYVALYLYDGKHGVATSIGRWTSVGDPTDDELASIEREASRALGRVAWEPD